MSFPTNRLNDGDMKTLFNILLEGLGENARLDEKKKIVNSILPVDKYKLLLRFTSRIEGLICSDKIGNVLRIFLDERTKFIGIGYGVHNQSRVRSILEIIPQYSPNIQTIDFSYVNIGNENEENFITMLKQTTKLKSLRIRCMYGSLIRKLLLKEDFNLLDRDVQIGLQKIETINGKFTGSECVRLLKLLPNLKSFGMGNVLSRVLP